MMMKVGAKFLGTAVFATMLMVSGCGEEFKALNAADQLVSNSLRSPSSYDPSSKKVLWKGVNQDGDPAYIIRVDYDAQNGFGATIRGCNLVAFYLKGDKFGYLGTGLDSCMGSPGSEDERFGLEITRRFNNFVSAESKGVAEQKPKAAPVSAAAEPESSQVAAAPAAPPEKPVLSVAATQVGRFGTASIRVDKEAMESFVFINEVRVPKNLSSDLPSFRSLWEVDGRDIHLIALGGYGVSCPSTYAFLIVEKGKATVTNSFGNCSDEPSISEMNGEITIEFPGDETEVVRYTNGQVFQRVGSAPENRVPSDSKGL